MCNRNLVQNLLTIEKIVFRAILGTRKKGDEIYKHLNYTWQKELKVYKKIIIKHDLEEVGCIVSNWRIQHRIGSCELLLIWF